ncbi:VanZ family protein [bacterium]|nr:VanZ family protein [bacterium]MBU1984015.1 VanZ family protein [bacterium]
MYLWTVHVTGPSQAATKLFFSAQFWVIAAAIWTTAVLALALSPDTRTAWLVKTLGDKLIHALAFAGGAIVWVRALQTSARLNLTLAMAAGSVVVLLVGAAIELLQSYVPTRSSDVRDFVADLLGVLFALLCLAIGRALRPKARV